MRAPTVVWLQGGYGCGVGRGKTAGIFQEGLVVDFPLFLDLHQHLFLFFVLLLIVLHEHDWTSVAVRRVSRSKVDGREYGEIFGHGILLQPQSIS